MRAVERPLYPYTPRKSGIPLNEFPTGWEGRTKTGSGRNAYVIIREDCAMVIANENRQGFHLIASLDGLSRDATLFLNLQTRVGNFKHPDLYAARFVRYALNHFNQNGIEINAFEATWEKGSDNYAEFLRNWRSEGLDKLIAARETWTGRIITELGFVNIEDVEILPETVYALFRK